MLHADHKSPRCPIFICNTAAVPRFFLSLSFFLFPVFLSGSLMSSYQYPPPPQQQYYTPPPAPGGGYGPPPPAGGYYQPQYVHTIFVSFYPG